MVAKLGLDFQKPVVIMGTAPFRTDEMNRLVEVFCLAAERLENISALVRLHPSEKLETYAAVARRHPRICFFTNADASLDASLAAADVVVVQGSGLEAMGRSSRVVW